MTFFSKATSQTLNTFNKTILLHFDDYGISVHTYPLPPFNVPERHEEPYRVSNESLITFLKDHDLTIVLQDEDTLNSQYLQGIYVRHRDLLADVYIPVKDIPVMDNVPFSNYFSSPLPSSIDTYKDDEENSSMLKRWERAKDISRVLKEYTFYTYATSPDTFSMASFHVDPDHSYDLEMLHGQIIPDTPIIYRNSRIIVTDQEIAKRLYDEVLMYVKQEPKIEGKALPYLSTYEHRHYMQQPIQTLETDTYIYHDLDSVRKYFHEVQTNHTMKVYMALPSKREEVYCYGSTFITEFKALDDKGRTRKLGPCWLQYVDSDTFQDAFAVAREWARRRINRGYYYSIPELSKDELRKWRIQVYKDYEKQWKIINRKQTIGILVCEFRKDRFAALLPTPMPYYQ